MEASFLNTVRQLLPEIDTGQEEIRKFLVRFAIYILNLSGNRRFFFLMTGLLLFMLAIKLLGSFAVNFSVVCWFFFLLLSADENNAYIFVAFNHHLIVHCRMETSHKDKS